MDPREPETPNEPHEDEHEVAHEHGVISEPAPHAADAGAKLADPGEALDIASLDGLVS